MSAPAIEVAPIHSAPNIAVAIEAPLAWLVPNPRNPRRTFDDGALDELAESLKRHGMLEPIVAREVAWPDSMQVRTRAGDLAPCLEVIAGERRLRAAIRAGLEFVPVRVLKDVDDRRALELTIIENLQRVDLDAIEEAQGYAALRDHAGMSQTAIAAAVKRSQPAIAKSLGLLRLPDEVLALIRDGTLSPGHGHSLAQWAPFPRYLRTLTNITVARRWTTRHLAEQGFFVDWTMIEAGDVRQLARARFNVATCAECPFGALRTTGNQYGYCLRPDHFDELQAAALAAEQARIADEQARIADATREAATEGAAAPLRLADLSGSSYRRLEWGPPAGCTKDCPCRMAALDGDGKKIGICVDPKRMEEMRSAEDKAAKKAKRQQARERAATIAAFIGGQEASEHDLLALLAWAALRYFGGQPALRDAGDYHAPGWTWLKAAKEKPDRGQWLDLAPDRLLRVAADAILRHEILQQAENGYGGTQAADWFEGQMILARARSTRDGN